VVVKPLITCGFAASRRRSSCAFRDAAKKPPELALKRFHWRTLRSAVPCWRGRNSSGFKKESQMAWKTPTIVEVAVGMEINMYACAARK
jgi:coenzyme PQQ precursor peptide PqqA